MGEGKPLDETTRSQMESLLGHDLKEVRVHDSRQAGELARRLGGEAFTTGAHVFGPSEKLTASTSEGAGLLAHEVTHVVQQTKPRELAWQTPPERLLAPIPVSHRRQRPAADSLPERFSKPLPSGHEKSRPSEGRSVQFSSSSDMYGRAIQRQGEELEAQATEQAVRRAVENVDETVKSRESAPQVDPEAIASMVYRMMLRDLVLER